MGLNYVYFLLILKFFSPETRCIKIDLYDCVCCGGVVIADSLLIMYIYAVKVNMAHRVNIPPGGSKHKKNYIFFSRQSKTSMSSGGQKPSRRFIFYFSLPNATFR